MLCCQLILSPFQSEGCQRYRISWSRRTTSNTPFCQTTQEKMASESSVEYKCRVTDANKASVDHSPLTQEKVISGEVTTGATDLGENSRLLTGIWEHSVGVSIDVEADEVFVVLSGKGRVYVNGEVLELYPGVVGVLTAGASTRWEIDEPIRKVYVFPK